MRRVLFLSICALALFGGSARAQVAIAEMKLCNAAEQRQLDSNHYQLTGSIECESNKEDLKVSADQADYYKDKKRLVLTGHVVVVTRDSRIAADKADIDTQARTGTFYNASGTMMVSEQEQQQQRALFGAQEPIAYFYGETVTKVSDDTYRITHGAFTTCVQPSPRWEFASDSAMMRVDKYAVMTNTLLKVKEVPLFWLPAMYYPINKNDRSTGFLMPIYGTSTLRGPSISNAFFWAINRSSDLTLLHDWYSKTGQQYGTEFRYVTDPTSQGQFRFSRLQEHATESTSGRNSFDIRANAVQHLDGGMTARANVDYFSNIVVQQQYQQDIYAATLRTRTYGANWSGTWGHDSFSATVDRNDMFNGAAPSNETGSVPRITYRRAPTPIFGAGSPLFFTATSEFVDLTRLDFTGTAKNDYSLSRVDVSPQLQFALNHLSWLTFRTSATLHETHYTRSCQEGTGAFPGCTLSDEPLTRQFGELMAKITGPIFQKVWTTPDNGFADRWKHTIEPEVTVNRTTAFGDYDRIFRFESDDSTVGGTTRVNYSVTNRLLAHRAEGPASTRTVEWLNIQVQQTYYSKPAASTVDGAYSGAYAGRPPSNFSPIALTLRSNPTPSYGASARLEYNTQTSTWETIQLAGSVKKGGWIDTTDGFTSRKYTNPSNPATALNTFLSSATKISIAGGNYGGLYAFELNVQAKSLVQQRIGLFYNAQCCGIGFEYQSFNYPNLSDLVVQKDNRFNLTFTLAGVGTFSNLLGAFGIGQGPNGVYGKGY